MDMSVVEDKIYAQDCGWWRRSQVLNLPEAGVAGGCKPHGMDSENQIQVLCKGIESTLQSILRLFLFNFLYNYIYYIIYLYNIYVYTAVFALFPFTLFPLTHPMFLPNLL